MVFEGSDKPFQSRHEHSVVELDDILLCAAAVNVPDEFLVHGLIVLVGFLVLRLQVSELYVELVGLANCIEGA